MFVLTLISFIIISLYIGLMIAKNGVPCSISETYYSINHKCLFPVVMLSTAFTLLPPGLEASTESTQFLMFISMVSMTVIGLAPNFAGGEKSERITHHIASAILFLCTQLWVGFNLPIALLLWLLYITYMIYGFNKIKEPVGLYDKLVILKSALWAEIVIIFITYTTVCVKLLC